MPTSTPAPVVILDGAVPWHPRERCRKLVDYAEILYNPMHQHHTGPAKHESLGLKLDALKQEVSEREENPSVAFLYWDEVEDDIIKLIDDMLPEDLTVIVGRHTPGDVIIDEVFSFDEGDQVKFSVEMPVTRIERVMKTGKVTHVMADGTLVVKADNDTAPGHYLLTPSRATRSE